MAAQGMILRIKAIKDTEVVVLQGRCGFTVTNHARNLSPCHLPNMDGTIRPDLAVPPLDLACSVCNFPDNDACMLLCDSCGAPFHTHCLSPPLSAVPAGDDWFCPHCTANGITAVPLDRPTAPERAPKEPNLFPTPQTRSRDLAAKACDKMVVIKHIKLRGSLDKEVWGIATYLGDLARPWYFNITYDDGQVVRQTTAGLRKLSPLPTGTVKPTLTTPVLACINPSCQHPTHGILIAEHNPSCSIYNL
eukprot:gene3119-biopygen20873